MNAIDIIILAIVVIAAVTGALKGIVAQIGAIAAVVAAIVVCRLFGGTIADIVISHATEHETLLRVICYALVFLGTYLLVILLARLFGAAVSAMKLRPFDRIAGAVFRVAEWLILFSVVLNIYLAVCPSDRDAFCRKDRPWREFSVDLAPRLAGYIVKQ